MSKRPVDDDRRAAQFNRKLTPARTQSNLELRLTSMRRGISGALADQGRIHQLVKTICRPAGVPASQLLAYSAAALQMHRLKLRFGGDAKLPIAAAIATWSARGMVPELLAKIRNVITGIGAPPSGDTWQYVPIGAAYHPMAYNPATGILAVLCTGDDLVTLIDTVSLASISVATATGPKSLAWNTVTNQLYVVCYSPGVICAIDGATHVRTDGALPDTGGYIAVDETHNRAWITTEGSAYVFRVHLATLVVNPIATDNPTWSIAVDPAAGYAWAGAASDYELYQIDLALGTVITVPLTTIPMDLALDTTHHQGIIDSAIDASCSVFDLVSLAVTDVALPGYPLDLALDPARRCAFILASWPDNTCNRVHLDTLALDTVIVPTFPPAIACDPGAGKCLIGNVNNSSATILDSDSLAQRLVDTGKGITRWPLADPVAHRWFIATWTPDWLCILTPAP